MPARPNAEWPVVETHVEWSTEWFEAGYDLVERPDGERARYYWVAPPDGVSIVATRDDDLVLVEQYRPRLRERFVECPAGAVDRGESPLDAAARELREETGFAAEEFVALGSFYLSAWTRAIHTAVYATDLTAGDRALEDGEFLDVRLVPVEAALARVRRGPTNGWTLPSLLLAREEGLL